MVRPHPDWSDQENGYKLNDTHVLVYPAHTEYSESGKLERVGLDPSNANSFAVLVQYGGAYGGNESLVNFAHQTDAWEFANGVTWFLSGRGKDPRFALEELTGAADPYEDSWTPSGVLEEQEAEEVLRKMAGHYEYVLDEELDDKGVEW